MRHTLCWDAGTGNGQAAAGLAEQFAEVVATDASADQIANATPHPGVIYRVAPSEDSGIEDATVDLVTVAQALHWFALRDFYEEVNRVTVAGGAIAVWAYDLFDLEGRAGEVVARFHARVEPYWPPERELVVNHYADLFFPFEEIPVPKVAMAAQWTLDRVLGYVSTWSAVKGFTKATGHDPISDLVPLLSAAWGDVDSEKTVTWPLVLRAGRIG